jgi:hypothetical protein
LEGRLQSLLPKLHHRLLEQNPGFPPHTIGVPSFIDINLTSEQLKEQKFEENFDVFKSKICKLYKAVIT